MRRVLKCSIGILVSATALVLLAAGPAAAAQRPYTLGASLISSDNLWWANVGKFLQQAAEQQGVKVIILWAQGDQEKQLRDVEDLVQRKVDGIFIGPVHATGAAIAFDAAAKAKIPAIQIARASAAKTYLASFIFDEVKYGYEQGAWLAKQFGPKGGKVAYVYAPVGASYPAAQWEGFQKALKEHPEVKLLDVLKGPVDTMAEGLRLGEDALVRFPEIDAFVGNNDDLALGALRAAESAGRAKKIIFLGNSGVPMGMQAIYEKRMHYTSLKSPGAMIVRATEAMVKHLDGKPIEKENLVPPIQVTQETVLSVRDPIFGGTLANPATYTPK